MSITNAFVKAETFTLEDQGLFFEYAKFGEYAVSFDIKSAYHQIKLHEDSRTFAGFSWIIDGAKKYFQFKCFPFGLTSGPMVCKKMFRPLVCKWRNEGFLTVIFFDDGILCAKNYDQCKAQAKIIKSDLLKAHILPNCIKSIWKPQETITWLGYFWNFSDKCVSVSQQRSEKINKRLLDVKKCWPKVTARKIAGIVGSIVSMSLVLQDRAIFYSRFLQNLVIHRENCDIPWDTVFNVTEVDCHKEALDDLFYLLENFESLNHRSFLQKPFKDYIRIFGDASNKGLGGYMDFQGSILPFCKTLTEFEKMQSSTYRELLAVKYAIETFSLTIRNKNVLYITDSQTTERIMRRGSIKTELHSIAKEVLESVSCNEAELAVAWVPRLHNSIADLYSNVIDYDDWSITTELFDKISKFTGFKFDVDVFATNVNAKCESFYSRFYCKGTKGIDSFNFPWMGTVWAVPPPRQGTKTVMHFVKSGCTGVIILPKWIGQGYWALLNSDFFQKYVIKVVHFPGQRYIIPGVSGNMVFKDFRGILSVYVIDCSRCM